jgi:ParB family chromosome partitioning protein
MARVSGRQHGAAPRRARPGKDADTAALEKRLVDALGLQVTIDHRQNGGGAVEIRYRTLEQLDEIVRRLETAPHNTAA